MTYYISRGGQQHGPYAMADLQNMLAQSQIDSNDLVWGEGMSAWAPLSQVVTPAPAPAPSPAPAPAQPQASAPAQSTPGTDQWPAAAPAQGSSGMGSRSPSSHGGGQSPVSMGEQWSAPTPAQGPSQAPVSMGEQWSSPTQLKDRRKLRCPWASNGPHPRRPKDRRKLRCPWASNGPRPRRPRIVGHGLTRSGTHGRAAFVFHGLARSERDGCAGAFSMGQAGDFRSANVVKKIKDAYRVAGVIVGLGKVLKIIGIVVACLSLLGGIIGYSAMPSVEGAGAVKLIMIVYGVFGAVFSWLIFWLWGVVISAVGQLLRATLDGAVHTSPFLSDDQRAEAMGV